MESFVYPPYSLYQGYRGPMAPGCGGGPKPRQPSWKQSKGSGAYLGAPPAEPLPLGGADCADSYRRAQLKALLSQVSPGLTPRLRKANTREAAVQVNPRVDAAVQCSLGPRPLSPAAPCPPPPHAAPGQAEAPKQQQQEAAEAAAGKPPALGEAPPADRAAKRSAFQVRGGRAGGEGRRSPGPAGRWLPALSAAVSRMQFLEQKYGYFHCKDCKTRWESAYVWCISGSNKVPNPPLDSSELGGAGR